ncbi:MAG: BON domain-containing protein [Terriglobales bacterium]
MILLAGILAIGLACTKAPDDSQLTRQIQSKLNEDSGLHGKPIAVETSGGVVTISGTVENETQREAAARYAAAVPGIKEVVNNLETSSTAAMAASNQMSQTLSPENSPAKALAAKPRPSTMRHGTKSDFGEMSANGPPLGSPPAVAEEAAPEEQPAPAPAAQPVPPPPPPAKKVTVPSGTSIAVRLIDPIDSEKAQPGQTFRATLDGPLPSDGDAVPSGYDVKGHIEDVKSAGKFAGQSLLVLQLDSISVGGKLYGIDVDPYRREGKNRSTNTAEKVGGGAVLGAILGGIIGGGKGAGVGAVAGGGLGGGAQAASKSQQIQLPSETVLNFTLRSPLTVTLAGKSPDSGRQKLDSPQ